MFLMFAKDKSALSCTPHLPFPSCRNSFRQEFPSCRNDKMTHQDGHFQIAKTERKPPNNMHLNM